MKIASRILENWKEMKEEGDLALLMELTGKSEGTIYKIFSTGYATVKDASLFKTFFDERRKAIASINTDSDQN